MGSASGATSDFLVRRCVVLSWEPANVKQFFLNVPIDANSTWNC
jgi:hypothetical protein